jgi:signal peptidase I
MDDVALRADAQGADVVPSPPRARGAHRAPKASRPWSGNGSAAAVAAPASTVTPDNPQAVKPKRRSKDQRGRHRRIRPDWPLWIEIPVLLTVAVLAAFLVKTFLIQVFFIPSVSMENTLLVNDRVLVDKLSYDFRDLERGQVIVFDAAGVLAADAAPQAAQDGNVVQNGLRSFASALGLSQSNETDYIKRIIGLPGDRVTCCDEQGRVTVNGVPLDETAYLFPGDVPSTTQFDVVVPADRLWVMGDHRSASADSRSRIGAPGGGFVPIDKVVGRAFVRTWPVDRIGTLPVPDTFKQPAIDQNRGTIP